MANKFTNYIMTMSGILVLLYFLGVLDSGFTNSLLAILLEPSSIEKSTIVVTFLSILSAIGVTFAALRTAGFEADSALIASMMPLIIGFGWDFLIVFQTLQQYSEVLAVLLFSPFILLYILTCIEWWRGVTT